MTSLSNVIMGVEYKITFSNINSPILGQTDIRNMESDISIEISDIMIYKSSTKFKSFDEYIQSEEPNIIVDVIVTIDKRKKVYTINQNLLMYIYNYKFDEYYVESEYEISDWAISSTTSSSSSLDYEC